MQISSLRIENLRSIKHLDCSKFARITLVGGKNNCGKTTLLEAIKLLAERRDSSIGADLNSRVRNINLRGAYELRSLFNNPSVPIVISAVMEDGTSCTIETSLEEKLGGSFVVAQDEGAGLKENPDWEWRQVGRDSSEDGKMIRDAVTRFAPEKNDKGETTFGYTEKKKDDKLDWPCLFVGSNARMSFISADYFKQMTIAQEDRELSKVITSIYPDIFTVKLVDNQLMVKARGYDNLLPAKVAGDGVLRIVTVLACIWRCRGGCLCVDEIDNGLHYSVLEKFWQAVMDFTRRYDVQFFATTHHLEVLEALSYVARDRNERNEVEYIRLTADEIEGHLVDVFPGDELDRVLSTGFELRG